MDKKLDTLRLWGMAGLHMGLALLSILLVYIALAGGTTIEERWPVIATTLMATASVLLNLRASILFSRAIKHKTPMPMLQLGSIGVFLLTLLVTSWFLNILMETLDATAS